MECLNCKSQMYKGTVSFDAERNGNRISLDDISAWICDRCDESLFEVKEVNMIQDKLAIFDLDANNRQA